MARRILVPALMAAFLAPAPPALARVGAGQEDAARSGGELRNAPLEPYRKELLDLAFRSASAVPAMPHIKTRSLEQEQVFVTCLQLDQPQLALGYLKRIDNWRRAVGYADLAQYLVQSGRTRDVERYLEPGRSEVEHMRAIEDGAIEEDDEAIESFQSWRMDRIRARIARAYLTLGREDEAAPFETGLEASESGVLQVFRARTLAADRVPAQVAVLEAAATDGELDRIRNAVDTAVVLLERFWEDAEKRKGLLEGIEKCLEKAPFAVVFDTRSRIAEAALAHGDHESAVKLLQRAGELLEEGHLVLEDELPLRARLAVLRARIGDQERARAEVATALERFRAGRASIESLQRADVLVPIAEALVALGERDEALAVYGQAARDGAENPNAVPRTVDLVRICCSLATTGIQPDAALWRTLQQTNEGLHEPW